MREKPDPHLIVSPGTQIVTRVPIAAPNNRKHAIGTVAVIVSSPVDHQHAYRVRLLDRHEVMLRRTQFAILKELQREQLDLPRSPLEEFQLLNSVIYRCVIGSRAYGLDSAGSDVDRRGIYLPPAHLHWSIYGVPEQLEVPESQECYWELQKFVTLALKANPNILECLYTPLVEHADPLARELVEIRQIFLSRLVYQTYNGYILSQFRKLTARLRSSGRVKWKHAMHLIRLLLAGIVVLREGHVPLDVGDQRDALLAIRRGERTWEEIDQWRLELHARLDEAYAATRLPDRPDYARANDFLIKARRTALDRREDNT